VERPNSPERLVSDGEEKAVADSILSYC
jgi:hypothetical protein